MAARVVRLGLIGCGNHGRGLARTFAGREAAQIAAVADVSADAARAAAEQLGGRALSVEAMLADRTIEAVLVATPNATHVATVAAAAEAGKHIYCEKPMALTVEDCDAMIAAASAGGVKLQIGHMQRFFPLLVRVGELARSGAVGEPLAIGMCRRDLLLRKPGWLRERRHVGGILFQSSTHEFDWLHSVFGPIGRVLAQAASKPVQAYLDFPDAVFVQLRFASGVMGALEACMSDYLQRYDGVINGSEGTLAFDLHRGTLRWKRSDGAQSEARVAKGALSETYHPAGARAADEFLGWVRDEIPPSVTGAVGRHAVAVACAAERSIESACWETPS